MNILLVDDKKIILDNVSRFLNGLGHNVEQAVNGLSAFEKTHLQDFDLFIIDHLMPVMNGIQLVKRLKQQTKTQHLPVIFMSTQDIKELQLLKESNIVQHVISKPIDFAMLSKLIAQYHQQDNNLACAVK